MAPRVAPIAIDVHDGAVPQRAGEGVILLTRDIPMHLSQQLQRLEVDARMVLDVLAVVDRGVRDRADREIFVGAHGSIAGPLQQHPARRAQIRECVQVIGMRFWHFRAREDRNQPSGGREGRISSTLIRGSLGDQS